MSTALVTGAGIRVGRAIALGLAGAGYDLILHAHHSRDAVEAVAREVRALGREAVVTLADLSIEAGQQALAADVEKLTASTWLDVVVHSAAAFERVAFDKIDRDAWRKMLALNLEAPFFVTQALLPALRRAPNPSVVCITDIAAERPIAGYAHYTASKAALTGVVRALSAELAPEGIRVNGVAPGTVIFPEDFDAAARERIVSRIPLRREGTPDDVAKAIVYLVRDAPYVTGHVLAVDGGRSSVL
jgi:pteridine reductase